MNYHINKLESELLKFLLPQGPSPDVLFEQLKHCRVVDREYSGHGFFTSFEHEQGSPKVTEGHKNPFGMVYIESPQLEYGGGAIIFFKHDLIECLEAYAYGEGWPREELKTFALSEELDHEHKRSEH